MNPITNQVYIYSQQTKCVLAPKTKTSSKYFDNAAHKLYQGRLCYFSFAFMYVMLFVFTLSMYV